MRLTAFVAITSQTLANPMDINTVENKKILNTSYIYELAAIIEHSQNGNIQ
jgi:hypothetical protein